MTKLEKAFIKRGIIEVANTVVSQGEEIDRMPYRDNAYFKIKVVGEKVHAHIDTEDFIFELENDKIYMTHIDGREL